MGKVKKKKIRIIKKKSKSTDSGSQVKFELSDFEGELSQADIDALNQFCNQEFESVKLEEEQTLQGCLEDELERATEYEISNVNGLMDWLALASVFGWNFIKQERFSQFEQDLLEPSSVENDTKLVLFIEHIVTD